VIFDACSSHPAARQWAASVGSFVRRVRLILRDAANSL
jgi:hypothetical protein